jgi:hypothetical protein
LGFNESLRDGAVRFWGTFGCRCGLWPAGALCFWKMWELLRNGALRFWGVFRGVPLGFC